MPIFILFLLFGGAFSATVAAFPDGHFECVQVIIRHAEKRQKVETQQYWANVYQRMVESGALRSEEHFLEITKAQASSFGFGYGVLREMQTPTAVS